MELGLQGDRAVGLDALNAALRKENVALREALQALEALEAANERARRKAKGEVFVEEGARVDVQFHLTRDDTGEQIDSSAGKGSLGFTCGQGQVIRGLDVGVVGMAVGETRELPIQGDLGFGEYDKERTAEVPVGKLPAGLTPGTPVEVQGPNGQPMKGVVVRMGPKAALLDFNHPLAGKPLTMKVTVIGVREAADGAPEEAQGATGLPAEEISDEAFLASLEEAPSAPAALPEVSPDATECALEPPCEAADEAPAGQAVDGAAAPAPKRRRLLGKTGVEAAAAAELRNEIRRRLVCKTAAQRAPA